MRQWQRRRVVDGVGGASHVGPPRIRPRLAPAAGILFSAEGTTDLGNDPRHQAQLRATLQIAPRHELEVAARAVSKLPSPAIPGYAVLDAGYSWRASPRLGLSLRVRNLFDARHPEFEPGTLSQRSEFGREGSVDVEWRW